MIIAISGKINSGKDTVGKIIQLLTCEDASKNSKEILRQYKFCEQNKLWDTTVINNVTSWKIEKFGGPLKQIVSILTGIPAEDLEKQEVKDMTFKELYEKGYISKSFYDSLDDC